MSVSSDKLLLFTSHACSKGLDGVALREISDAAEIVHLESGDILHHSHRPLDAVYLVVHGRLRQTLMDIHDSVLFERFLTRGCQFGALAAAQVDPVPVQVAAVESTVVLKLDFSQTIQFTRKYEQFGLNLIQVISGMVREILLPSRKPKRSSLVTVFHHSAKSHLLTEKLVRRLSEVGESICIMSDRFDARTSTDIPFQMLVEDRQWITRRAFRRQISEWSESDRIILDIDASLDPVTASMLFEFSDQVIWCCDDQDVQSSVRRLEAIEAKSPGFRDRVNLVWILGNGSWVTPDPGVLANLTDRSFKIAFSKTQPDQSSALLDGFERLIHQLRGIRIGLALGGGGARGMAHLGVLKALEQNGIVVDMIAGTSAGAMTGILHAAGFDPSYIVDRFVEDLKPGWPFRMLPGGKHWYLVYKYRRGHFDRMLKKYLSEWNLEQLPIPVQSVTVDLVEGKPVTRQQGNAVNAILESINLPVFSSPICRDGQALVDGGLVDNIPADILVQSGCTFVIAVSVTSTIESDFASNTSSTATRDMRSPSTLQTVLRSYLVQHVNMNSIGVQSADIVIEPSVAGVDLSDFSKTNELAIAGEQAAIESMPRLRSLLSKLDDRLFRPT